MANATYEVPNFLGGEISQAAQGRFDRPDYKVSLNVCLNAFPVEIGAWTRRPGTQYGGHTRKGGAGRTIKFDFEQSAPVTLEFTDSKLRFRNGAVLIATNDAVAVSAISADNPAVVQVASAVTWATGDTVMLPGASTPLLENRQLAMTVVDGTHFSIADAVTGVGIDGSTLGPLVAGATVAHVQELTTIYTGQSWQDVRAIQAETTDVMLCPGLKPQILTVPTLPSTGVNPVFSIADVVFNDGPYLDPFTNGAQVTPDASSGIVTLTVTFPPYGGTTAYAKGAFITSSGSNYVSLVDQNVGNTPASSPAAWQATAASAAINDGRGFLGSDIGRLIRLLSEPPYWNSGTTYGATDVVSYNPSGTPGATTYWQSQGAGNLGHAPGSDLKNWSIIAQGAAIWTWGKIIGLSNIIDRALAGSVAIGDFTSTFAAFDGVFSKVFFSTTNKSTSGGALSGSLSYGGFVGKNYVGASPQKIQQATVYPTSDFGFGNGRWKDFAGTERFFNVTFTFNLRARNSAPASEGDGVLLGSVTVAATNSVIVIPSNDQASTWNYVWVELVMNTDSVSAASWIVFLGVSQISFYSPTTSSSASTGCRIELLGPPLIYSGTAIPTWRLGAFSDTTGWPTCGCYDGGRIYLGGAIANRWDACVSNGISGVNINFAPTDQFGAVATSNAISYTFNSDSVNKIVWMSPELQGIVMGTQAGEWLVQAPTAGPISPTNVSARRVTKIGCANIEPRRTEHTLIFIKRYARKVMEYFADVYSGKFSAPNLADRAQHITRPGVAELAYTEAVTPVLWGRNGDGSMFGVTYKRDALTTSQGPTFAAWHRHTLGSGRTVESICSGPSIGGDLDALTMVTNDAATGIRHVEVLTDTPDELTDLSDSWFLDDAVNPTSATTTLAASDGAPFGGVSLNGLWHLNGKTVQVFAGGLDCGDRGDNSSTVTDFTVANGSVFVPFADGVSSGTGRGLFSHDFFNGLSLSQIIVGFTYNSDGQIVRRNDPAETGARNGPALGKKRRTHRYSMLLSNTRGLSVGARFTKLYPSLFKQDDDTTAIGTLDTFSGVHQDAMEDDYTYDGMMCWRVSRPFPMTLVALAGNTSTQDQ